MEQYYEVYEVTAEPLQAFKISKIIIELLLRQVQCDHEEVYFKDAYES
mgnify:CR=1 FL=1